MQDSGTLLLSHTRVIFAAALLSCFITSAVAKADTVTNLQERLLSLEKENSRLRETTEFQMEEILELRRKIKEDPASALPGNLQVYSDKWHLSAGAIFFSVFFSGDAISDIGGGFTSDGKMVGYRASAGKGRDRISGTVYTGDYRLEDMNAPVSGIESYSSTTSERTDIDLMWMHIIEQDEIGGLGLVLGYKYLFSDKTVYKSETYYSYFDEKTFEGDVSWHMLNAGVFASARLFNSRIFGFFLSANVSLGIVDGMVPDIKDDIIGGSVRESYDSKTMPAWGFNASAGLRCMVTEHAIFHIGYRGQVLNGMDGELGPPLGDAGEFYDGHQSVFMAFDIVL